jgi:hypothetical protein
VVPTASATKAKDASRSGYGDNYAWRETILWDREDRDDAREEIGEVLGVRVGADWSEDDVEELIDDILGKYARR